MNLTHKLISCLVTFILCVSIVSLNVFADEVLDHDALGSIEIDYTYDDQPLENVEFQIYQVADLVDKDEYVLCDKFENFDVDFDLIHSESYWIKLRDDLQNTINSSMTPPCYDCCTNDNGCYTLDDLELGLYIILTENIVEDDKQFFCEPTLIMVGDYCNENDKWLYDFKINPKIELTNFEPEVDISVKKIWENVNSELLIPRQITVDLYKNGKVFDSVILNDNNMWSHVWENLPSDDVWAVLEREVPYNYTVHYSENNYKFQIINVYDGDEEEELPQTSSFANKIPIFSGIGIALILIGVLLNVKKTHKN